jgi:hypothetical protein
LISWLESCHIGEFLTGTQNEVLANVAECSKQASYKNPTETLLQQPPPLCNLKHPQNKFCSKCSDLTEWWKYFENNVDDLIS